VGKRKDVRGSSKRAACVRCGEVREVCCNEGAMQMPGRNNTWHVNPTCAACCNGRYHGSKRERVATPTPQEKPAATETPATGGTKP
jgi:hypothetical protein